ncbi:transglycosylase domain-containing protein [Aquimarina pacifica]|uniref:transglycosylase domain-containing protein n=1 Tax=Aquimarina pacifica TaxID=1296415 RepID=UPI00046EDA8F|nr:transglycosylase domain-containing protein [Aquimarina pacifica]
MKKLVVFIKRMSIVGILLFTILLLYTKYCWKSVVSKKEVAVLVSEIREADALPETFYELYEADNPKSLTNDLNMQILNSLFYSDTKNTPCSKAVVFSELVWRKKSMFNRFKLREISLSWKIEGETTQKECLNWVAQKYDFLNQGVGIKQAAQKYFGKGISDLSEKEFATLVVMMRNPSLYNPSRRKELVDQNVYELIKKME